MKVQLSRPGAAGDADPDRRAGLARRAAIEARRALLAGSGLFDGDWYRRHHPAAAHSDLAPLDHYLAQGIRALASPGPLFDAEDYLRQAWHLRPGVDDPLTHYLQNGLSEGRRSVSRMAPAPADPLGRPAEPLPGLPAPSRRPSIAVVVHVFYVDLFAEICERLAMLPYRVTLLVTTDEPENVALIEADVARAGLDVFLLVRVCANRGRNFGPFLTAFRDAIAGHELVLHLHTKKSLYSGAERSAWRQILLRTLLPARPVVAGLIERFVAEPTLGVLSASPGPEMRYWAYSWLSNRPVADLLCASLGISLPPSAVPGLKMLDFPMGGMFWARTAALRALLDFPWVSQDFPEEGGEADGTVAHALERLIVPIAAAAGYSFSELDYERGLCRVGWSSRNLEQYRRATHAGLCATFDEVETVSFDLFDTLLSRICLTPDTVHRFIGLQAEQRFAGATGYVGLRRAAEDAARLERGGAGDVDLDEIHARFRDRALQSGWSAAAIAFVQREEVARDSHVLAPRAIMLEALAEARRRGKRILVTSDSYLPRRHFDALLAQSGIGPLIDAVFLSCEQRARKDRGDLWSLVAAREQGPGSRLLHVGDNAHSDIQRTADAGIRHFHVMEPSAVLALRGLDLMADAGRTLGDDILLGPVAWHLGNSPYLEAEDAITLTRPQDVGAMIFGPLLLAFIAWIIRHPATRGLERLYFASREGWFLKRLYEAVVVASGQGDLPPARYLHCSRRAALAAAQGRQLDPETLLAGAGFNGTLGGFFKVRLGYVPDPALGHQHSAISLPRDAELVRCMIALLQDPIRAHGQSALRAFSAYASGIGLTAPGPLGLVDVGYGGTIQAAIQTALGRPLVGLYMGLSHQAARVRQACGDGAGGHAFAAFAQGDVAGFTGVFGLMLEAVLTAPHGQVTGYDDSAIPVRPLFGPDGVSQRLFPLLERVYEGVEEYALTLLRAYGPDLLAVPFRPETATVMLTALRDGRIRLSGALRDALSVEDDFCGNGEIGVADRLGFAPAPLTGRERP